MSQYENELSKKAKQALDEDLDQLDAEVCARLRESRQLALDVVEKKRQRYLLPLLPVWGTAAAVVLGLAVFKLMPDLETIGTDSALPHLEEMAQIETAFELELLTTGDDIEFYQNLEFFGWLEYEYDAG